MRKSQVRLLIISLWVGSLWTVGYLVTPTLFLTLADRSLAGAIAGTLFRNEAYLTVFCSLILIAFCLPDIGKEGNARYKKVFFYLVGAMLICTIMGYFGIHPFLVMLKESSGLTGVMNLDAKEKFSILHRIASTLYFIQSVLGIMLILKVGKNERLKTV